MFEKVNPSHPDKLADRIAGAIVDIAYALENHPRIAVEVLIGHGVCHIIAETSVSIPRPAVIGAVNRIAGIMDVDYKEYPQDVNLADNQEEGPRCGDNGVFCGMPVTEEQYRLSGIAREIYAHFRADGKYVLDNDRLVICQSNADYAHLRARYWNANINPLGSWTGGPDVDTGATNRKLGSDMGDSITGGGLHGKDLSKADVSVNIYCWIKAQQLGEPVQLSCAIGDEMVDGRPYSEIVEIAEDFIRTVGGFEKFAEWGFI